VATDQLTRPDADVEEALDVSIPCNTAWQEIRFTCPNEISWRITLGCCGRVVFLCLTCYNLVQHNLFHGDNTSTDLGGCGKVMNTSDIIARRVRV